MKKVFYVTMSLALLLVSCTTKTQQPKDVEEPMEVSTIEKVEVPLKPVENYFSIIKPTEKVELVLDSVSFYQNFNPAATMTNRPTIIDFDKEMGGAIILPATEFETTIKIDSSYIANNVLNIVYSVVQNDEKRSFTIVPVKVFTFDKRLDINSVVFKNGESIVTVAK
jgi:hypothetical protein